MKDLIAKYLKMIDWKKIGYELWLDLEPKILEKVKSTESQIDDAAYGAIKLLVEKFLKK